MFYMLFIFMYTHTTSLEDYIPNAVSKSAQAAITKYHRLGGLKHTLISHNPRGWKVRDEGASMIGY